MKFGGPLGGSNQFSVNLTINDNNPLSRIVLNCNQFLQQIDFVYADYQVFSFNVITTSFTNQYTIDLINKEIISIGYCNGEIMDLLEFCTRDLTTNVITCTRGCYIGCPMITKFDLYEIIGFTGDFNSGFYKALAKFGFYYIGIL